MPRLVVACLDNLSRERCQRTRELGEVTSATLSALRTTPQPTLALAEAERVSPGRLRENSLLCSCRRLSYPHQSVCHQPFLFSPLSTSDPVDSRRESLLVHPLMHTTSFHIHGFSALRRSTHPAHHNRPTSSERALTNSSRPQLSSTWH